MNTKKNWRTWVKLWVSMLGSSTASELDAVECWVWVNFLMLAGRSPVEGIVALTPDIGFTDEQLAMQIRNVTPDQVKRTKADCVKYDKVKLLGPRGQELIIILNWEHYQSDASRKRRYREKKKAEAPQKGEKPGTWLKMMKEKERKEKEQSAIPGGGGK